MDLETSIAQGSLEPVYVLAGDDPFLVDRVLAALRDAAVPPAARAFNYDVLDAKGGPVAILNAARTLPMMAKRRLVLVRDADALGAPGLEVLLPYLSDPSPSTVLVLLFAKIDGRMRFFATAKKTGRLHQLTTPRQLAPWVQDEARRHDARIDERAARRLADVVGKDLGRLASAIEQLSLYVGPGAPITADDVDDLIAETRERSVFDLTRAVFDGDRARALHAVARLRDQQESPIGAVAMLARHLRQLALAREHLAARTPTSELARLLGVPPFAVENLVSQAHRLPDAAVPRGLALLAQADRALKGPTKAALGERIVFERLVGDLVDLAERAKR